MTRAKAGQLIVLMIPKPGQDRPLTTILKGGLKMSEEHDPRACLNDHCHFDSEKIAALEARIRELEQIAEKILDPEYMATLTKDEIVFGAIKRLKIAENRIKELEPYCRELYSKGIECQHKVAFLEADNRKMREALEKISDTSNWEIITPQMLLMQEAANEALTPSDDK